KGRGSRGHGGEGRKRGEMRLWRVEENLGTGTVIFEREGRQGRQGFWDCCGEWLWETWDVVGSVKVARRGSCRVGGKSMNSEQ
nr:hypothetical protein [Tanacetum cinerariifolium]